jgi:anti-anti-sigma factor
MQLPSMSLVSEETLGEVAVVRLNAERLSDADVIHVRTRLFELAASRPARDFRLDLGRVEHLGSTGLALLISLHKRVLAGGGQLRLDNVRRSLYEVLALTRLTEVLDVRCRPGDSESGVAASA